MIIEIPLPEEYDRSAIGLLNTAWEVGVDFLYLLEDSEFEEWGKKEDLAEFWSASQTQLSNSFALIQQAQEIALKGRISDISPYLLISNDVRDWPKKSKTHDTPFFEFRSPNAADLIRIHDIVCSTPLSASFRTLYDRVRRERNVIQHHAKFNEVLQTADILHLVLDTCRHLFPEIRWSDVRRAHLQNTPETILFGSQLPPVQANREIGVVRGHLTAGELRDHYDYGKRQKWFECPSCQDDLRDSFEVTFTAQLAPNTSNSKTLYCAVCNEVSDVTRATRCQSCKSNVFSSDPDERDCLHCGTEHK